MADIVKMGFLFKSGGNNLAEYTFKRILIQEVSSQSLLKSVRKTLYGRIADILEKDLPKLNYRHSDNSAALERLVDFKCERCQRAY